MFKIPANATITPLSKLQRLEGKQLEEHKRTSGDQWFTSSDTFNGVADNHPSKRFKDIVVGGQWVATVYQSGAINVSDKYRGAVLAMNNDYLTAEQVAKKVAAAVKGSVTAPRDWR